MNKHSHLNIDYLVTTINRTENEVIELVERTNIKLGNILVGNQGCSNYSFKDLSTETQKIYIFNLSTIGVSKNRNFLLSKATGEYVTFWDDDELYLPDKEQQVNILLKKFCQFNAIRFNVSKKNENYKQLHFNKKLNFVNLSHFGSWGIFIKRTFLQSNKLFFNELLGPGTDVIFGEDTNFNYSLLRKTNIYQIDLNPILINPDRPSTWKSASLETKIISQGTVYYLTFNKLIWIVLFAHIIKHKTYYCNFSLKEIIKMYKIGIKKGKEILK